MTWLQPDHLAAAALCLVVAAILGWFVPALIARLPEPEPPEPVPPVPPIVPVPPEAGDEQGSVAPPPAGKETYRAISQLPGLARRTAVASGAVGALLGAGLGWDWRLGTMLWLAPMGVALALIDWRTTLLPTRIIAPSYAAVGLLTVLAAVLEQDRDIAIRAALGWAIAGGVFLVLWLIYPRGMGYGDVRLSGVLGIGLGQVGYAELAMGVYGAFLIGGFGGLVLSWLRIVNRKRFPFGPFMLLAALLGILFGGPLARGLGY